MFVLRDHDQDELSHYSNATTDIEYKFPFGWGELWGIADRTDFDLKQHMEHSGDDFNYIEQDSNERYIPYCIEPSLGADRVTLAFLIDALEEQQLEGGDSRTVMHLHPAIAPFKAAIFPLSKKLSEGALKVFTELSSHYNVDYDDSGSIGRRIAVMMKLEHLSVLLMILTPSRMDKLLSVIVIRWNR